MTESFLSNSSSTLGGSLYESTLYESAIYEEQLESLERSILNFAPYTGASVAAQHFDLKLKLRLKQANFVLAQVLSNNRFVLVLYELMVHFQQVEEKYIVEIVLENMRLSELYSDGPNSEKNRVDLIRLIPMASKHKPTLRCNIEMFTKKGT